MDDDLGKRITEVDGFEWKRGMVEANGMVLLWRHDPSDDMRGWRVATESGTHNYTERSFHALDLDHDANTGFLLEMLFERASVEITTLGGEKLAIAVTMRDEFMYRSFPSDDGEHINHALARAIIAASEASHG